MVPKRARIYKRRMKIEATAKRRAVSCGITIVVMLVVLLLGEGFAKRSGLFKVEPRILENRKKERRDDFGRSVVRLIKLELYDDCGW